MIRKSIFRNNNNKSILKIHSMAKISRRKADRKKAAALKSLIKSSWKVKKKESYMPKKYAEIETKLKV